MILSASKIPTAESLNYYDACFIEHHQVAAQTQSAVKPAFQQLLAAGIKTITNGGKIFFFGNGGSAADAQHLATELTVRFKDNRKPIAAIALTTDTSALTAIGNDYDFSYLFARQIEALCRPEDLVIGITTSGKSPNVLKALEVAREMGAATVMLTGEKGAHLTEIVDILLAVPSTTTARIQEMHITLGQIFCGALEQSLGLVPA